MRQDYYFHLEAYTELKTFSLEGKISILVCINPLAINSTPSCLMYLQAYVLPPVANLGFFSRTLHVFEAVFFSFSEVSIRVTQKATDRSAAHMDVPRGKRSLGVLLHLPCSILVHTWF